MSEKTKEESYVYSILKSAGFTDQPSELPKVESVEKAVKKNIKLIQK